MTRKNIDGAVHKDGDVWCIGAPHLDEDRRIPKAASPETRAELNAIYDQRAPFRFSKRADEVNGNGSCRIECPARAGRVKCSLIEETKRLPVGTPEVINVPTHPGKACTQATITVPVEVIARRQRHSYGTTKHSNSMARRTAVERGYARARKLHGRLDRFTVQCNGLGVRILLYNVKFAMGNLEAVDTWRETHPDG
ncbi:MAG: hypothetical protein R2705_13795 [Ilumatobacteraceae bacterium]